MFDDKPLMVVDVPVTPELDPLFVGEYQLIVYEPMLSCASRNVIDEVVDKILVGGIVLPGTERQIHFYLKLIFFAIVTRHFITSQFSFSGVIKILNDLYVDLKST